jgi:hypothetical protein
MSSAGERKQAATTAVANYARASSKQVDVVPVEAQVPRRSKVTPPRLRFDRVVLRVFERLRTTFRDEVPGGVTVVFTLTAPIRVPGKTVAVMEERIRALLGKRTSRGLLTETIHGNEVRIRILRGVKTATAPLVGFVHNRDSDTAILFDLTHALLQCVGSIGRARTGTSAGRWLAIAMEDEPLWTETYRYVCAQVFAQTDFKRVLLVAADGEVSAVVD